jgi:hypothetical protein
MQAPERKKPGPKPLPDGEGRTARFHGRTRPDWLADWQAKADSAGLSLSGWLEATANRARK